jgi:hypothetical protein
MKKAGVVEQPRQVTQVAEDGAPFRRMPRDTLAKA